MTIKDLEGIDIKDAGFNGLNAEEKKELTSMLGKLRKGTLDVDVLKKYIKDEDKEDNITGIRKALIAMVKDRMKNKKKSDSTSQSRVDVFLFPDQEEPNDFMREKFERTDEGFLQGRAVVTNVGVFKYTTIDGGERFELRLPEEVFDRESMRSLEMVPITDSHPIQIVDTENIKEVQAGHAGDDIRRDDLRLSAPLTITDPDTIMGIKEGKRAISCGYTVDIEEKKGKWMGVDYDVIQRNIRYNHIAVNIERGRAGDDAVIKLDSIDAYHVMDENKEEENKPKEVNNMSLKKVKIDGVDYEAEAKVIETLHTTQSTVEELQKKDEDSKKNVQTIEAERDSLKDENEALKKDIEDQKKAVPEKIDEAVKARIVLVETAKKADVEVKDEMSDTEIKKAVIVKAFPKSDEEEAKKLVEKLDKAEDSYIDARFDSAIDYLEDRKEVDTENKEDASDLPNNDEKNKEVNADKAEEDMHDRITNAWNKNKESK